ncbi:Gfo/Idh/MocA family oxidoreductase [Nitriliruptoraceae bacterium ZYF776]|nr:Gfo/Idh/MocA family oxidoreductase [Profundirhabdus halotolerans]
MAASPPLRWGIVATGGIATTVVADLQADPDAQVVAVVSRSSRRARGFAREHGIPRAYDDVDALLADGEVDVVYVATPHPHHAAPTRAALEAGVAVLCEKPLTADLDEAQALIDLARERGVFLAEAMWMRCHPLVRHARQLVIDGAIGEVRVVDAELGFPAPPDPTSRLWAPELGGGALWDVGVYAVAFSRTFLPGAPQLVGTVGSLATTGVDAEATLLLGTPDGTQVRASCSLVAPLPSTATVVGTRGSITFDGPLYAPPRIRVARLGEDVEEHEEPRVGNGYGHQLAEVHACLRAGRTESELLPLDETLDVLQLLTAAREALGAT